ncbi:GNAT family N-acetyltransferase [Leucobacter celer]|jgi:ElaA protein|uniref:GNAT family N-acetyltransferase n=1 Tax=Leucobacter celer TaxID=668625 RepID=UPI0006A76288|nr:GNAT family N-acetyltransferase [Leucobacter celer]
MAQLPSELTLRTAQGIDGIPTPTFYRIAKLRQEVFVVEQDCVYLDLDGRDLEDTTVQLWVEDADGTVAATVRILDESHQEPGLRSIGRVVTAPAWRGQGIAAALLEAAIAQCDGHPILIHAQAHLESWYGRFGFAACGDEFLEDGIPHLPMRIG